MYAARYFARSPSGQKQALQGIVQKNAPTGVISIFVDINGMTEEDREKLSAYVVVADEMGYTIGPWRYTPSHGTGSAQAPITLKQ